MKARVKTRVKGERALVWPQGLWKGGKAGVAAGASKVRGQW